VADAWVDEAAPDSNFGAARRLKIDGGSQPEIESYLMFNVNGLPGTIVGATLRLYPTTGTKGGLSVYAADSAWSEIDLTWTNRPTRIGEMLDEVDEVDEQKWLALDVGEVVDSNGIYTFVVTTDSADGTNFSSLQGSRKPELVLAVKLPPVPATATFTPEPTSPPPTAVSTATSAPTSTATSAPIKTATPAPTNTPTTVPTPQPLSTIAPDAIIFEPAADSRVDEAEPNSNRGTGKQLRVDGDPGQAVETYLVFRIRGFSGVVTNATLRVYALLDTAKGPDIYAASSEWVEGQITWATKPSLTSSALDSVGVVTSGSWIEFDVTAVVNEEGVYTFMLSTGSTDGMNMYSRENPEFQPYLAVTVADSSAISTDSNLPPPLATWTPTAESAIDPRRPGLA